MAEEIIDRKDVRSMDDIERRNEAIVKTLKQQLAERQNAHEQDIEELEEEIVEGPIAQLDTAIKMRYHLKNTINYILLHRQLITALERYILEAKLFLRQYESNEDQISDKNDLFVELSEVATTSEEEVQRLTEELEELRKKTEGGLIKDGKTFDKLSDGELEELRKRIMDAITEYNEIYTEKVTDYEDHYNRLWQKKGKWGRTVMKHPQGIKLKNELWEKYSLGEIIDWKKTNDHLQKRELHIKKNENDYSDDTQGQQVGT